MAARINTIIGSQAFELIRNRIGEILAEEIEHQYYLTNDEDISNVTVWVERFVRFDASETPCINVSLVNGDYSNHHQGQSDGDFIFNIDCYASADTTEDESGDVESMFRVQKLLGLCRAILEDPQYKTLLFPAPFIKNRHARSILISQPDGADAKSVTLARLVYVVRAVDTSALLNAIAAAGTDTSVKLNLTNRGYVFTGTYTPPTPPETDVTVNINGVQFAIVESGETLDIEVLDQDGNPVGSKVGDVWVVNVAGGGTATVENSDASYVETVNADDTLVLPDTPYELIVDSVVVDSGNIITLGDNQTITIDL
jgi:hypothetical protein